MADEDDTDPLGGKRNKRTQKRKPKIRKPPTVVDDCMPGDLIRLEEASTELVRQLREQNRGGDFADLLAGTLIRVGNRFGEDGPFGARLWDETREQTYGRDFLVGPKLKITTIAMMQGGILCRV